MIDSAEANRERIWIDVIFMVLFLSDLVFRIWLLASVEKPFVGPYRMGLPLVLGPVIGTMLLPTMTFYLGYQGWLLYQKFSSNENPYRPRLRRVTLVVFGLTILVNLAAVWIMSQP
jgi:hypothetical protein